MANTSCEDGEPEYLAPCARRMTGSSDPLGSEMFPRLSNPEPPSRPRSRPRRMTMMFGGLAASAAIVLLSGCVSRVDPSADVPIASPTTTRVGAPPTGTLTPVRVYKGLPSGVVAIPDDPTLHRFAWAYADDSDAAILQLVTTGSSSCPHLPISYAVTDTEDLEIIVSDAPEPTDTSSDVIHACTADGSVTTSILRIPKGVTIPAEITISLADGIFDSVTIPVREDPEE